MSLLVKKNKELLAENKELRDQLNKLKDQLEEALNPKFTFEFKRQARAKGSFIRVIIPDTHGSKVAKSPLNTFLNDLEELKPKEIVLLGDHLDCGGFLAQHQTLGYVAESEYSFADDIAATNSLLDNVHKRVASRPVYHYLEGNHEHRIEKWIITQTLRHSRDANLLRSMMGPEIVLNIKKRKINYYRQGEFYHNCKIPATIKLGKCYFTHGSSTAKFAAKNMVDQFGLSVVHGHTHRMQQYIKRVVEHGAIGGWSPGCLCELQPYWMHTNLTDWSHGYGVQVVSSNGWFLHINVPIVDNISLLRTLLK